MLGALCGGSSPKSRGKSQKGLCINAYKLSLLCKPAWSFRFPFQPLFPKVLSHFLGQDLAEEVDVGAASILLLHASLWDLSARVAFQDGFLLVFGESCPVAFRAMRDTLSVVSFSAEEAKNAGVSIAA